MSKSVTLNYEGKEFCYPLIEGTEGERAFDISKLRAETGLVTYDPGLGNTAHCKSSITFVDGENGILHYRGIPIQQLVEKPSFIEVAWLVIFGRMPQPVELQRFRDLLTEHAHLHESMKHHFEGFPVTAHPMAITSAMINTLSCFHPELSAPDDDEGLELMAARLISKIRTIAAYAYRRVQGLPYVYPDPQLHYCANFLHMMFSMPFKPYVVDQETQDALNLVLLLHADHEQNCSTATVRLVASSRANLFASCAAGVCALWGPLHGGANVEVINMLQEIQSGGMGADDYIERAKRKDSRIRLQGFGHRVYKNYDPRAKILKTRCDALLRKLNKPDPLLDIALRLEERALADSYFVERKLYPNVDFYSGIIFRALGIPLNMFTVMFSIGRLPGWIAQWKEERQDPGARLGRPRQVYIGTPMAR